MSDKEKSLDDLLTIREYFMVAAQELQAGNQRIKELEKHIKRLEEAGDKMDRWCSDIEATLDWRKAKEAKL